jgi:multidrug resistance protein
MMEDFEEIDIYLSAFVISIYVLGYAVGPLIIGPLSEVYGRLVMYHVCNVVFTVFTTLCGITKNLRMLAIMRFFAGCGGASAFTLGPATVSDLVPFERRGGMYAVLGIAYNLGPAVSPLVGSYVNDVLGWRWIFWLTEIMGGVCTVATFTLSETYELVLLRRKAQRLRKERHNPSLRSVLDTNGSMSSTRILAGAMLRPLRMLLLLPNVFFVSLLTAVGYGYMYILYTTLPTIFLSTYYWQSEKIGLAYLGTAIGNLLGMVCGGPLSDFIVKRHAARGDTRPENRLIPMIFFWPLVTAGFVVLGWTAENGSAWYWPLIGTMVFGMGAMSAIVGTYARKHHSHTDIVSAILRHLRRRCIYGALGIRCRRHHCPTIFAGWLGSLVRKQDVPGAGCWVDVYYPRSYRSCVLANSILFLQVWK